jgi:putative hemolysin
MKNSRPSKRFDTSAGLQDPVRRTLYKIVQPVVEQALGFSKLNKLAAAVDGVRDPIDFCKAIYKHFGVTYSLPKDDIKRLQEVKGPLAIVCNHPFGGLEALLLMIFMAEVRKDFRVMANHLLAPIDELRPRLILVDPFHEETSSQFNRQPMRESLAYLKNDGFMAFFPSGEVMAYNWKKRKIVEPEWNPNIAKIIQKTGASVVPIYFHGYNSLMFQFASLINPKLRTALLVREFVNKNNRKLHFQVGSVISAERIGMFKDPAELTAYLKSKTYILGTRYRRTNLKFDLIKSLQPRWDGTEAPEPIIPAVDAELMAKEIAALPPTNLLHQQKEIDVLVFEGQQCPGVLRELGRLREVTFRDVGEGTGKSIDVDKYDNWYHHLILWHREKKEVVGSYRIGKIDQILEERGKDGLYNNTEFHIRPQLYQQINPALELGRAFVRKEYQRSYWSLLLLWTGIGRFIVQQPKYHTLIGSVSISAEFRAISKDLMVQFLLDNNFDEKLQSFVRAKKPYKMAQQPHPEYYNSFSIRDLNDVQDLISEIESTDLKVPILIKHYLKMGGHILAFNVDTDFNNVLDGLMCIDLRKTDPQILRKYMGEDGYAAFSKAHKLTPQTQPVA